MILLIKSESKSVYLTASLLMKLIKEYGHKKELSMDKVIDELKLVIEDQDSPLWDQFYIFLHKLNYLKVRIRLFGIKFYIFCTNSTI
jgi:hypothetical protein